jgi:phage terminase small subunit
VDDFQRKVAIKRAEISERQKQIMTGIKGRSGRKPTDRNHLTSDGKPESPRPLSEAAQKNFEWLSERLDVDASGSVWQRLDGVLLAAVAELMTAEAELSRMPPTDKTIRLRVQLSSQLRGYSSLLGLCPRDRSTTPQNAKTDLDDIDDWEAES